MKRLLLCGILCFAVTLPALGQSADDQYLQIYNLIQSADLLEGSGQAQNATARYQDAQQALQKFQKAYPEWNPKVVSFRLNYLAARIGDPVTNVPVAAPPPAPAPVITPEAHAELQRQVVALQENLRQLQGDKSLLEAKLKEALAAQPAALDPRELARAQEQIKELQKENELLKTTAAASLPPSATGEKAVAELRESLAEANRKVESQTELAARLTTERESLQKRIEELSTSPAALEALRAENEILRNQLAEAKAAAANNADAARQLETTQARLVAMQSDAEVLRLEKIALENRVKNLIAQASTPPAVVASPADLARIKLLETERDEFARKLTEANKELSSRRGRAANARIEQLNGQIDALRARVQVFEARAVPYSAEELALFQKPAPKIAAPAPKPEKKPISQLPSGVTALVASAQRHFAAQEFDKAEAAYLEILRRDENNAYTLANLAAIQLERGNLADAEQNATKAVTSAPDDDYSLLILGQVKFRQQQFDAAMDAFNRAAKLKPQSAEIQNYLGVVLGHKGLRDPAEQAFRRAIVLNPEYADAHYNLAVFYGTKDASFVNLARWHYQRAVAGGHARNADLEKVFEVRAGGADNK